MQLTVGDIVEGKITGVTKFGVFVDLGNGQTGMVHISEIAQVYVSEIKDFVKENDVVKMKVLNIGDDGKISLSIKKAQEPIKTERPERREKRPYTPKSEPAPIDSSFVWTAKKSESTSFEEMMNKFKQTSDEKFSDLKRKNPDAKKNRRAGQK